MAFNDFLKKAKDMASSAADSAKTAAGNAKTAYEEKKKEAQAQKEERERVAAEKQAQADAHAAQLIEAVQAADSGMFALGGEKLAAFTADFYDKLYLPAHSVSASKWILHPMDKKINKYAQKDFADYDPAETPVFLLVGKAGARILLTTKCLRFKQCFEDGGFFATGSIPLESIGSMEYVCDEQGNFRFLCNGQELMNTPYGFNLDVDSFAEYTRRIHTGDLEITNQQIDALIQKKIGEKILAVVREYVYEDELLLYFAWGGDSITAKDFVVCSDKQMVILDREAFGLTKNVKQFYYEDVTSMATLQETNGLLDLALTAALSLCDLEVSVAGAKELIRTLFTYEAEKAVKVYRECRRTIKESAKQPQVVVQQAAPAGEDPLAQLEKLNKLKEMGVITDEEFAAKKADLLAKL